MDQYLLDPYFQDGNFDATNGLHPEKNKYPPKNRMMQCPMLYDDYVKFMKAKGISIDNNNSSDSNSKLSEFNSI